MQDKKDKKKNDYDEKQKKVRIKVQKLKTLMKAKSMVNSWTESWSEQIDEEIGMTHWPLDLSWEEKVYIDPVDL